MNKKKYVLNFDYIDYSIEEKYSLDKREKSTIEKEVKKSLFLGTSYYIKSEKDVNNILDILKENHTDAKHIVYAYILEETGKYSDDGEPTGSAGKAIYKLLEKEQLINTLIVVIRYFGGTLLGRGLLTRTYLNTAKETIAIYGKVEQIDYEKIEFEYEYNKEKEVSHIIKKTNSQVVNIVRDAKNKIILNVPKDKVNHFSKYINK